MTTYENVHPLMKTQSSQYVIFIIGKVRLFYIHFAYPGAVDVTAALMTAAEQFLSLSVRRVKAGMTNCS